MKPLSKIFLLSSALLISACQMQDSAEIVYDLDDYIADTPKLATKEPAIVEEVPSYQAPDTVIEEQVEDITPPQSDVSIVKDTGEEHNLPTPAPAEPTEQTIKISETTHIVKAKDTLYSISRQYDIPILPIIIANNLQVPFDLKTGQTIKIPEGTFHLVQANDTLYSISRKYGVDMSALTKINGLSEPFSISKGQKLQIPFSTYHSEEPSAEVVEAPKIAEDQSVPVTENLYDNTAKPETEPEENSNVIRAETPQEGGPASLQKTHQNFFTFKNDKAVYDKKTASQIATAAKKPDEKPATTASITPKIVKEDSRGISKTGFMWPVEGKIVKKFGSQSGNEYNDGINISATAGTEVKASSAGRVVYTGDSLKSFGNLVIVKHDNGLLSAYAHLDKINVSKDQKISRGQILGTVGSSGKVGSPQLYFAIRKGKEARDPNIYLP